MSGFHGAFATGVACQQGTLTLPDTWFRPPLWDLLVLQLLRPDSSNLPCLYSTFYLEYPLVLSRFCFGMGCVLLTCVTHNIIRFEELLQATPCFNLYAIIIVTHWILSLFITNIISVPNPGHGDFM